jgi:hypothetical protein
MGFIFILLYVSISTILQLGSYQAKSYLPRIIMAALLINFSLFFSKVVIDGGNIVAHGFYSALTNNGNISMSASFKNATKIGAAYDPATANGSLVPAQQNPEAVLNGSSKYLISFMRLILMIAAIYVFLSVIFIFVGRIIGLTFVLMLSPIGFIGSVLPGASGASRWWWSNLIDQTLVAPVFFVLYYLAIQVITGFSNSLNRPGIVVQGDINPTFYINYIIAIGLLMYVVKTTKKLGGEFGSLAQKIGGSIAAVAGTVALGVATGGSSAILRTTLGRAGASVAASDGLKAAATSGKWWQRPMAKIALGVGRRTSESSFDVRDNKMAQMGIQKMGLKKPIFGIDPLKAAKENQGGYVSSIKAKREKEQAEADRYKPSEKWTNAKAEEVKGLNKTKAEQEEAVKKQQDAETAAAIKPVEEKFDEQLKENKTLQQTIEAEIATNSALAESLRGNLARQGEYTAATDTVKQKQDELKNVKAAETKLQTDRTTELDAAKAQASANFSVLTPEQIHERSKQDLDKLEKELAGETDASKQAVLKIAVGRTKEKVKEIDDVIKGIGQVTSDSLQKEMEKVPEALLAVKEKIYNSVDPREALARDIEARKTMSSLLRSDNENKATADAIRKDMEKGYKGKGKTKDKLAELFKQMKEEGELPDDDSGSKPAAAPAAPPPPPPPPAATS